MGLPGNEARSSSFDVDKVGDRRFGNGHPSSVGGRTLTRPSIIHICHLTNDLDLAGAERTLVNVVRHLDPARFSNEVVSLIEPGILGNKLRAAGIPVMSLGMQRGRPSLSGLVRLVRHLRQSRPTILQTWLYHADLLGTVAYNFAPSMKLVWNLRCSDIATSPGSNRLRGITRLLARISHWPEAVIVNSTRGRVFHEQIGYQPRSWVELPNGVDTEQFRPRADLREEMRADLGIRAAGPVIGMVARYHPMKDHATFIRASAKFAQTHPEARFVLCGLGCDEQNRDLNRLIDQAGLLGRVILLGFREDTEAIYPALDLLTLCSAYGEGFPNVLTEAMACGVPCVATDVGACREIIADGRLIVPPHDPAALAETWRSVLLDSTEALPKKLRTRAVEHYRIDRVCRLYEATYDDLASAGPSVGVRANC